MPSVQCTYCGYRIILPAQNRFCPSCGKSLNARGTVSIDEESQINAVTLHDDPLTSSSTFASDTTDRSSGYTGYADQSNFTRTSRTEHVVDDFPSSHKHSQSYQSQAQGQTYQSQTYQGTGASTSTSQGLGIGLAEQSVKRSFFAELVSPSPQLRGTLVHQATSQIDKTPTDGFSMIFKALGDILWPVHDPHRKMSQDKKTVTSGRVRLASGQQREIRFEGDFTHGSIALGDDVSLWGRKKKGTLVVSRAFNHTTEARVATKGNTKGNTTLLLLAVVALILSLIFFFDPKMIQSVTDLLVK